MDTHKYNKQTEEEEKEGVFRLPSQLIITQANKVI